MPGAMTMPMTPGTALLPTSFFVGKHLDRLEPLGPGTPESGGDDDGADAGGEPGGPEEIAPSRARALEEPGGRIGMRRTQ